MQQTATAVIDKKLARLQAWAARLGRWYLYYLALLPAVGTFVLLGFLHIQPNPVAFLLVGTAGVGIYLAMTGSYTKLTTSPWKTLLMFADGPIWAAMTLASGASLATAVTHDVLIEMTGALLGLFGVVLVSSKPTKEQRRGSIIAVGLPLVGAIWILAEYGRAYVFHGPYTVLILLAAVLQGAFVQYKLASDDQVHQPAETVIIVGIVAWVVALMAGYLVGTTA